MLSPDTENWTMMGMMVWIGCRCIPYHHSSGLSQHCHYPVLDQGHLQGVIHRLQALSMALLVLEEQDVAVEEATAWKQDQMVVVAGLAWTRESTEEEAVDLPITVTMVHLIFLMSKTGGLGPQG
jgi:hypothetical protein